MTSIFISYSRRDKAIAEYIAAELRNRGADVFLDYQRLEQGSFVQQLGEKIANCDHLVLLLSPHSVESPWVQAEVTWAFTQKRPIVPVLLDSQTSMVSMFVVAMLEQVDFTHWSVDGDVQEALEKLSRMLKLPATPLRFGENPHEMPKTSTKPSADASSHPHTLIPFKNNDLAEIYMNAIDLADTDPEQAVFLFQRVLEIDPNYANGQARKLINREEVRLKPKRLELMQNQALEALKKGLWTRAERIAEDMLKLNPQSTEAQKIIDLCQKNAECEPNYQHAVIAAERGRWNVTITLLRDVRMNCPDYGDPEGILKGKPISNVLADWVQDITIIYIHSHISSLSFRSDNRLLAIGSADHTVRVWDIQTQKASTVFTGHKGPVWSVAFEPNGYLLATASADKTVRIWNTQTQEPVKVLTDHQGTVWSVAFASNSQLLASVCEDGKVRLWEISSGNLQRVFTGHTGNVYSVAFSSDGRLLASASDDSTIRVYDIETGRLIYVLSGHAGVVYSTVFSPNGRTLASTSYDATLKVWDIDTGRQIKTLKGHASSVVSAAFAPDGSVLASASADSTVRLWNVETGHELKMLYGHQKSVRSIAFSPDATLIASGSDDGTVRIWGL